MAMNFFEQQDKARGRSFWLILLFGLGLMSIIAAPLLATMPPTCMGRLVAPDVPITIKISVSEAICREL